MALLKAIYIHQGVQFAGVVREYIEAKDGWDLKLNQRGNIEIRTSKRPGTVLEVSFTNIKCALWEEELEDVKPIKKVI
jgi:hypothetical protein